MATLYIVRGVPGTGKSTFAKELVRTYRQPIFHFEADDYFIDDEGNYKFVQANLNKAHQRCFTLTKKGLNAGWDVVVANTFCTQRECQCYIDYAKQNGHEIKVHTMPYEFGSIHNVPQDVMTRMRTAFVDNIVI